MPARLRFLPEPLALQLKAALYFEIDAEPGGGAFPSREELKLFYEAQGRWDGKPLTPHMVKWLVTASLSGST